MKDNSYTFAQFDVDRDTHQFSVRIRKIETGQVVRTISPQELAHLISLYDLFGNGNVLPGSQTETKKGVVYDIHESLAWQN